MSLFFKNKQPAGKESDDQVREETGLFAESSRFQRRPTETTDCDLANWPLNCRYQVRRSTHPLCSAERRVKIEFGTRKGK